MKIDIKNIKIGNRYRKDFGDLEPLKKSISEIGLLHPVVINEKNKLIAGERRLKACKELKMEKIPITKINLKEIVRGEYDENNVRKEFTITEKVAIWKAMENLQSKPFENLHRKQRGQSVSEQPIKRASKVLGISTDSLSKANQVIESGKTKLIEEMDKKSNISGAYRKIKVEKIKEELKAPKEITKKYSIIYADPAWDYNRKVGEGIASEEYNTSSLEQMKQIPLSDFTEQDSVLFMWVTFPMLKVGLSLMESWGFKYKTLGFNWIKLNKNGKPFFGIGHYTKSNSEICLLGIKGKGLPVLDNTISQIVMTEKSKHSKKPEEIRDLIVRLFGNRKRIELFARDKPKGWDVYGDEVKNGTK